MTAEKRVKRCYGWPYGSPCENQPGSKWGPNWCQPCDEKRIAHLDEQIAHLDEQVKKIAAHWRQP